jgi:hypothetical protein
MLALFDKKYENLIADHPDAMKEMDLLRAAIVQNVRVVQVSSKMKSNDAKWKHLAERVEAQAHPVQANGRTGAIYWLISPVCRYMQRKEGESSS